jgi:hypothetical protein
VSAPVLIAFFVIIPLVGWLLLSGPNVSIDARPPAVAPPLFDENVACPNASGPARHRADRDAEGAIARSERYPFDAQDGVRAVTLFRRATACYRAVGATQEARLMQREGDLMQRRIEGDYAAHQVRLRRALQQNRLADALLETQALIELLRHREGNGYLTWLRQLSRQLQLAIDTATT